MSLVNIHLQPNRALVAVDTEVLYAKGGGYGPGAKMALLPHANSLLAIRGLNIVLGMAHFHAVLTGPATFDSLAEAMPGYLAHGLNYLESDAQNLFGKSAADAGAFNQELYLVGYSDQRGRMCALVLSSKGSKDISVFELEERDAHFAPWTEAWGEPIDPNTPERMRFISQVQVDKGAAMVPDAPIGGRLLLCELTKDEAKFSSLGVLYSARGSAPGGHDNAPR